MQQQQTSLTESGVPSGVYSPSAETRLRLGRVPDDGHMLPSRRLARGLGWFSIGLGLAEVLAPRLMARATGLHAHESLVKAYGWREIATGVGLLFAKDPTPWLWGRVAGDALDLATLGTRAIAGDESQRRRALSAAVAVAGVTALDVACATAVPKAQAVRQAQASHDYSDRSGLPQDPECMRGAAVGTFDMPDDMRTPEALRPYTLH
ncbi:hypothetical protein [Azohydromonas aeria]|uniref:hypothetical protein n=1 Tax=Azohydromonas aeria TaxID=2590212 RepID=UPI001E499832|nr:hypothetical protein [Azohydromonas aeria]